jgi:hypothetical protein
VLQGIVLPVSIMKIAKNDLTFKSCLPCDFEGYKKITQKLKHKGDGAMAVRRQFCSRVVMTTKGNAIGGMNTNELLAG